MTSDLLRFLRLATALLILATSAVHAEAVWRDNFDAGPQQPWISVRGDWTAADGTYQAQQPGNSPVTAAILPYELVDFSFEVDLLQPADGGLWVRANADATAGVILVVFADRLYWHVISDPASGPWTPHGFANIVPALGSGTTRVRVTGNGPILRAYLNDDSVAVSTLDLDTVATPPGSQFLRGRVGLYDNASPGTRFDNVRLEAGTPVEVFAMGDAGNGSVRLYPVDAEGDVAPLAVLEGASTGLTDVRSVAFDSDHLYVSSGSGQWIRAFAMGTLGNRAPLRIITGSNTLLGGVYGIELSGGELYASTNAGPVSVFDPLADGNVAPLRSLTEMTGAYAIDRDGAELFIARHFADASSIYAYAGTASGMDPPLRHINGPSTLLGCCNLGLAATPSTLLVSQYFDSRILAFARNANGDAAPLRVISGSNTGMALPVDIALRGNEVYVANSSPKNVLVFPVDGDGNIAPIRTIGGPSTGMDAPFAIAFGVYMIPDTLFDDGFE